MVSIQVSVDYLTIIKTKLLQSASFGSNLGFQRSEETIIRDGLTFPATTSGYASTFTKIKFSLHMLQNVAKGVPPFL